MDPSEYFINETRGIYYTTRAYYDDLDFHYVVDFTKPDINKQFAAFKERLLEAGEKRAMRKLRDQFRGLRELLA